MNTKVSPKPAALQDEEEQLFLLDPEECQAAVDALLDEFRVGRVSRLMLPSLMQSFALNMWALGLVDQCCGVLPHQRGGAIEALQRAGVVRLETMVDGGAIRNQKRALLTPRARQALKRARCGPFADDQGEPMNEMTLPEPAPSLPPADAQPADPVDLPEPVAWPAPQPASTSWAQVQARYVMAQARPRVWAQVRYELLYECQNARFAEKAIWELNIGGQQQRGLTIRFAEAAARAMQNLWIEVQAGPETESDRTLIVSVTDLQANMGYSHQTVVEKYVLRRQPPRGEPPLMHSRNRAGQPLYRHPASEQDMLAKAGAAVSKVRRNLILTHLPHWLQAECKVELMRTLKVGQGSRTRGQLPREVLNLFAELGISALQVQEYLGHDVAQAQPAELELLRSLALALQDSAVTWPQALEARRSGAGPRPMGVQQAAKPATEPQPSSPSPPASEPSPPPPTTQEQPPARPSPPSGETTPPSPSAPAPAQDNPRVALAAQLRRSRAPYHGRSTTPSQA